MFDMQMMTVDGITSRRDIESWVGPMVDIYEDHPHSPTSWFRQEWNRPPTEAELTRWVKGLVEDL